MLETLSRSRTDEILVYLCLEEGARFSEFEHELDLNPSMVSRRLSSLVDLGTVEKDRGHYRITDTGRALVAAYNYLDGTECERQCTRESCVGPLYHAVSVTARCNGRPPCELLAAMPASFEELETETDVEDVDRYVEMLVRWDLVRRDGDLLETTDQGEKVVAMSDALRAPPSASH